MSGSSAIEWTDATWNPVTGCSKISPGCAHCYAETISLRFGRSTKPWTPENASENVVLHPERLEQPLRWRKPRMVFVNSMSDLFHDAIPYEFVRDVFNVMRRCDGGVVVATGKREPAHTFQVLTKRPERALELWRDRKLGFVDWPAHIWLGVSIENARFTWRADVLREIPAAVRFISAEPLLGSLFATRAHTKLAHDEQGEIWVAHRSRPRPLDLTGIDWLIVGGESGPRARPMHPDWAREIRDACLAVAPCNCRPGLDGSGWHHEYTCRSRDPRPAFFFKQWGAYAPVIGHLDGSGGLYVLDAHGRAEPFYGHRHGSLTRWGEPAIAGRGEPLVRRVGKKAAGRLLDGREWNEMPAANALQRARAKLALTLGEGAA